MSKLTEKQQKFVDGRVHGLPGGQAAIAAGYAVVSAAVTASQLLKRPDIQAAIRAGKKSAGKKAEADAKGDPGDKVMLDNYPSSLALMQHSYNNPKLPPGMRFEAAKQALPYEHGRVGEKGKKENTKDRAKEVGQGRFKAKQPPPNGGRAALTIVK